MKYIQESIYSNMHQRNDGSNKRGSVLANKIGAIFSAACGTATASRNIPFGFGVAAAAAAAQQRKEFDDNDGNERPISASNKMTQVHAAGHDADTNANASNCMELSCRRRPIAVASTLSGILTKKWKTSLKRVKVKLKKDMKTTMTRKTNAEAKSEMELCKKRILMGEKCRALNLSGVLHYDKQGILLPED